MRGGYRIPLQSGSGLCLGMGMDARNEFFGVVLEQLERLKRTQWEAIGRVSTWLGEALLRDGWLYAFGTGHSHLLAEEVFYRAGGLAHAVPMLDTRLMLHENAIEATYDERVEGYAARILDRYPVAAGDVLIVASNSGRNAVPTELALLGRERGLRVAAITNLNQSRAFPSRHSSGKKLADVAEVVIDNGGVSGDAYVALPGMPGPVGSTSTIIGATIVQLILVGGIEHAVKAGGRPEIYISSNTTGDDHNEHMLKKYRPRIRHL